MIGCGNFIEDRKPDCIIDIGDWGDFDSIGKYNKGKKESWGSSFKNDVDVFIDASNRAFGRIREIKGYSPRLIRCGGNHEESRITRLINDNPELEGTVCLSSLQLNNHGAKYSNFLNPITIDGVTYSHYFYDKDARYPLLNARAVLTKKFTSSVWGHSHLRDYAEGVNSLGRRVIALNVGCYLDPNQAMSYSGPQGNARWWKGLTYLHDVNQGEFDVEFVGIKKIQREYS